MKRLTLDETWTLCMKSWRWIARKIKQDSSLDVEDLKAEWLEAHTKDKLDNNCYFCEYNKQRGGCSTLDESSDCPHCPGQLVDPEFSCDNKLYHYEERPLAFYAELRRLHKIYKRKKK